MLCIPFFWAGAIPKDVDWKEYLTRVIETSRALYETGFMKEIIEDKFFDSSFLPPCQVEVLDSGKEVVWLVVHDRNVKDMEFEIHKNVENYGESKFARRHTLNSLPEVFLESKPASHRQLWVFMKQHSYTGLGGEPEDVADQILNELMRLVGYEWRRSQVSVIEHSTNGLGAVFPN